MKILTVLNVFWSENDRFERFERFLESFLQEIHPKMLFTKASLSSSCSVMYDVNVDYSLKPDGIEFSCTYKGKVLCSGFLVLVFSE